MKAVKALRPNVGVRLVSFAVHWIRAEIRITCFATGALRQSGDHQVAAQNCSSISQDEEEFSTPVVVSERNTKPWRATLGLEVSDALRDNGTTLVGARMIVIASPTREQTTRKRRLLARNVSGPPRMQTPRSKWSGKSGEEDSTIAWYWRWQKLRRAQRQPS